MKAINKVVRFWLPNVRESFSPAGENQRGWSRLTKHLIPNVGTLIVVGLFILAQSAGAGPPVAPLKQAGGTILVSYQGTLTSKEGGQPVNGPTNMVFAFYRQAEGGTAFWTESYTGANAVEVDNGRFHVLLGSQTALNPSDLRGNLYLGITVNGEVLLPREPFVSSVVNGLIVSGDGTTFIEGNLQIGDNTWTPSFAGMTDNDLAVHGQFEQRGSAGARVYRLGIGTDPISGEGTLAMGGDVDMKNHNLTDLNGIQTPFKILTERSWEFRQYASGSGTRTALRSTVNNKYFDFRNQNGTVILGIWSDNDTGGYLNMNGHPIHNCGALIEANLQTPEELTAERIDRFEEGDILCWADDRLEKCSTANDRLVQAVADTEGRPIVIGAEAIKVLGLVQAGDILVASDVPGYAMVNNDPRPGTVIAQALEDLEGEQGLVKAMIRKW
jgi:hypothetical protein